MHEHVHKNTIRGVSFVKVSPARAPAEPYDIHVFEYRNSMFCHICLIISAPEQNFEKSGDFLSTYIYKICI